MPPADLPPSAHVLALVFLFVLGTCCGSFLNVVVLRLPAIVIPATAGFWRTLWLSIRGLSYPPSHCPKCSYELKWYDNFPVLGWLWLRGKCRKCKLPISARYPLTEMATGLLFAGLYAAFFLAGPAWGPPTPARQVTVALPPDVQVALVGLGEEVSMVEAAEAGLSEADRAAFVVVEAEPMAVTPMGQITAATAWLRAKTFLAPHWPMLVIVLVLAWCLLAASLIDAEHYLIPRGLSYLPALVAIPLHGIYDQPFAPMSVMAGPVGCAWAIGGGGGLLIALLLVRVGGLQRSYASGLPTLEKDIDPNDDVPEQTRGQTTREMMREIAFLALPFGLGLAAAMLAIGPMAGLFQSLADSRPVSAMLGSLLGGLVGGGVIWGIRLFGSIAFGREAMGLGDVDLMFGVGCCLGAVPAAIAVFPAALVGLVFAVGRLVKRTSHELPFGPYLAVASILLVLFFNHVANYFRPAMPGVEFVLGRAAPLLGL